MEYCFSVIFKRYTVIFLSSYLSFIWALYLLVILNKMYISDGVALVIMRVYVYIERLYTY